MPLLLQHQWNTSFLPNTIHKDSTASLQTVGKNSGEVQMVCHILPIHDVFLHPCCSIRTIYYPWCWSLASSCDWRAICHWPSLCNHSQHYAKQMSQIFTKGSADMGLPSFMDALIGPTGHRMHVYTEVLLYMLSQILCQFEDRASTSYGF